MLQDANRRPMWTAPEINVDSAGGGCGRHRRYHSSTRGQCDLHRNVICTPPEPDVTCTGERCGRYRRRCGGTGRRCGGHRRAMLLAPEMAFHLTGKRYGVQRGSTPPTAGGGRLRGLRSRCFSRWDRWRGRAGCWKRDGLTGDQLSFPTGRRVIFSARGISDWSSRPERRP